MSNEQKNDILPMGDGPALVWLKQGIFSDRLPAASHDALQNQVQPLGSLPRPQI
jgi:hypothetical protein